MSAPLPVAVADGSSTAFANAQAAIWASLPVSLAAAADNPQLVAIDATSGDWPDLVVGAVGSGAVGVLVVRPSADAEAAQVRALAEDSARRGVAVVVESVWAGHPAVADMRASVVDLASNSVLVDSVASVAEADERTMSDVLLEHVAFVRSGFGPLDDVRFTTRDERGYTVHAAHGPSLVVLSAMRSTAVRPGVRLAAYASSGEFHLAVPSGDTAAPATAWFVDAAGKTFRPSWYESAARSSWLRLRDAVRARDITTDLTELAGDLDFTAGLP